MSQVCRTHRPLPGTLGKDMASAGHPIEILKSDGIRAKDCEKTLQVALEK